MKQKYYMGLDIGTGSVGWAITDDNYNVIRKHGKPVFRKLAPYSLGTTIYQLSLKVLKNKAFFVT